MAAGRLVPHQATAPPITCHPSSRMACSNVPRSKQLTTKRSLYQIPLRFGFSSTLGGDVQWRAGRDIPPSFFLMTPKNLNSACITTRIIYQEGNGSAATLCRGSRCPVNAFRCTRCLGHVRFHDVCYAAGFSRFSQFADRGLSLAVTVPQCETKAR
jgi:hypothetical protein